MSLLKTNGVQIGQSLTATNNFVWYQPDTPDGTIRLGNGNAGSVTDVLTINSSGNATFVGSVVAAGTSTSAADLKLYEDTDNGTNYVALKAPAAIASNITWTLPSADGTSGQLLSTNGSGTLSWSTVSLPTFPAGTIVGTTDSQTLTNKTIALGSNTVSGTLAQFNTAVTDADLASLAGAETLTNKTLTGVKETKVAMAANDIDLSTGNYFSKTISTTTTFTVSNVPSSGTAMSFILDLTNGGSQTINWSTSFGSNVIKWAGGTVPTLTASGRDVLGFFTHDGGTTWTGLVLGKDVK